MEKHALFVYNYGLNSHLKCSFKSILEKNVSKCFTKMFQCGALLFYVRHETLIKVPLFQETFPAPKSYYFVNSIIIINNNSIIIVNSIIIINNNSIIIFIQSHLIYTLIHFFYSVFFFVFSLTYYAGGYRAANTVMQQI